MMNKPSSAACAIDRAASATETLKLRALKMAWTRDRHHLDLVATRGGGLLTAVEAREVPHGRRGACVAAVTGDRFSQVTGAARAWKGKRGARFGDLRNVLVTVGPGNGVSFLAGNAAEVR